MKTWAKVGIGCLAALLLVCIVSVFFLFFARHRMEHWFKGFANQAKQAQKVKVEATRLDATFPFNPPENGEVNEARLLRYIDACGRMQPAAGSFARWTTSRKSGKGNFEMVKEATKKTTSAMKAIVMALKANRMGPKEFLWTRSEMMKAASKGVRPVLTEGRRQLIKVLQAQLNNPRLPTEQRRNLQKQIDQLETQPGSTNSLPSQNSQLYSRYSSQLEANNVDSLVALIASLQAGD